MMEAMEESVGLPKSDADRTEEAVAEFLEHLHDGLPLSPLSNNDDFIADRFLTWRTEAEFKRMVAQGKTMVDAYVASQTTEQAGPAL